MRAIDDAKRAEAVEKVDGRLFLWFVGFAVFAGMLAGFALAMFLASE